MTFLRIALLAGCASAVAMPVQAALIQVSSLSGTALVFSDAPGATYAAGTPVPYTTAGQTVTFTGVGNTLERNQAGSSYIDSNYIDGTQLIGPCGFGGYLGCNGSGSLLLSFSAPVLGFSIAADDFDTSQAFTFQATAYNGNTVLGQVSASSNADFGLSPSILAATSTVPITSLRIVDFPSASGGGSGDFVIGNIQTLPVPEPGSLALLAAGLAGLVGIGARHLLRRV